MRNYTKDEKELGQIKDGGRLFLKKIYFQRQDAFVAFIAGFYKCSPDTAKEVYPEAFARFYQAIKKGQLAAPLRSALQTYLNTVGKNLYNKRHFGKSQKNERQTDEFPTIGQEASVNIKHEAEARGYLVKKLLGAIDEKCRDLMEMYYLKGLSSETIAGFLKLDKLGTLRRRRFNCIQKLRELMQQPEFKIYYP